MSMLHSMRAGFLFSMVAVLLGCKARPAPAAQCRFDSDCQGNLVCLAGGCRARCMTARDCPADFDCLRATDNDPNSVCVAKERECLYESDCLPIETCGVDGKCRAQCKTDQDCRRMGDRQTCDVTLGVCMAPAVDAGVDVPSDSGVGGIVRHRLSCGPTHCCYISPSNALWCWGENTHREAGQANTAPVLTATPVAISVPGQLQDVACGTDHTCVVINGALYCFGNTAQGQAGVPSMGDVESLQRVGDSFLMANDIEELSAGDQFTCAMRNKQAFCFGKGSDGRLANGSMGGSNNPLRVGTSSTLRLLETGWEHACWVNGDDTVLCWGSNRIGQFSPDMMSPFALTPSMPPALDGPLVNITAINAGASLTCATVSSAGVQSPQCWGNGSRGEYGDNNVMSDVLLHQPMGLTASVKQLSVGGNHVCAAMMNGSVMCWGAADMLQTGQVPANLMQCGQGMCTRVPSQVPLTMGAVEVQAGGSFSCAVLVNNEVMCWGETLNGRLGNNVGTAGTSAPVLVVHP